MVNKTTKLQLVVQDTGSNKRFREQELKTQFNKAKFYNFTEHQKGVAPII